MTGSDLSFGNILLHLERKQKVMNGHNTSIVEMSGWWQEIKGHNRGHI